MICPLKPTLMVHLYDNSAIFKSKRTILEFCLACACNMAAVPHGAFAAKQVKKNEEKRSEFYRAMELNPMNYSSKYMNSIWGQYNRYSVHNLKKIMDDNVFAMSVSKDKKSAATQSVDKPAISTDFGSISISPNKIFN